MITYILWTLASILIAFSAFVAVSQIVAIAQASRRLRADKNAAGYSMVPLFGGVIGMIGFLLAPSSLMRQLCWIPLLVDPGCAYLFGGLAVLSLRDYMSGRWKS